MNTTITSTSLYYRQGASDKEYHVNIEPKDKGYVVNFAFGRRGSTLQTGTKTKLPVDDRLARMIFDKLVKEKKAKGYTEGPDGTPYHHTESEQRVTGILPQLLNPIDEHQVESLLNDTDHCSQEKLDGKRVMIVKQGAALHGINRKGLLIGLPEPIFQAAHNLGKAFILDGECIGDVFHAFDLLEWNGEDYRNQPYEKRYLVLFEILSRHQQSSIVNVSTCWRPEDKRRLFQSLQANRKEGIVFKRIDAPYTPGRPNSGGPQLKHKFYATLSAMVGRHNEQRSVELLLRKGIEWVSAGNVTIPANHSIPECGEVVEVKFLYAFKASGHLYQPTYLGVRSDVGLIECTVDQLKYKAGEETDE